MRKLLILFIIIIVFLPVFVVGNPTNATATSLISNAGSLYENFRTNGWSALKSIANIIKILFFLVGCGYFIVKTTPNKKDDIWYGKYILKPWKYIGNILTWFGVDVTKKKKK